MTSLGYVFYDTPKYRLWVGEINDHIEGRNCVTTQRHSRDFPGYVVLPRDVSKHFEEGFKAHAELYNTPIKQRESSNG